MGMRYVGSQRSHSAPRFWTPREVRFSIVAVSLDTLHRDRFKALTRFDQLDAVHAGIAAADRVFGQIKIDTVVIRGARSGVPFCPCWSVRLVGSRKESKRVLLIAASIPW